VTAPRCLMSLPPDRRACPDPAASPLGLCWRHLAEAAAEHARLAGPRPADRDGDPRPCAVPVRELCRRCGSWRHRAAECPTLADAEEGLAA